MAKMKVTIDPLETDSIVIEIGLATCRLSLDEHLNLVIDADKDYLAVGVVSSTKVLVTHIVPPPKKGSRK